MDKKPNLLWITALILGWIFDLLFWKKSLGINFALFSILCLSSGYYLLRNSGLKPAPKNLWLLPPIGFFAAFTFLRQEPLTIGLAYIFTIFSMGVLAATFLGGDWVRFGFLDYISKYLHLAVSMFAAPFEFIKRIRDGNTERIASRNKRLVWPVLRGLLIAIPIVIFFASMLASADAVFSQRLTSFFEQFDAIKVLEYTLRLLIILCCGYLLAGAFLHAASKSKEGTSDKDKPLIESFLGFIETSVILGSVSILFFLFVVIQFRYFFGGDVNIGVEGFTYSQYARRGFNELLIVALSSLVLILGLSTVAKRENLVQRRVYSGLSIAIVAFVIVILVSSYQRLTLANQWHGYSRLRLYPQIFLVWVGLLFIAVVLLEIFNKQRYFAFAALLASVGFAVSLSFFNVDAVIVRHNVLRAKQGKHFNVTHLAMLSTDAVPALVDEFQDESLSVTIHEGIGAALLCHIHSYADHSSNDWRSFNFSRWKAGKALVGVHDELDEYRVTSPNKYNQIRTPNDEQYVCWE